MVHRSCKERDQIKEDVMVQSSPLDRYVFRHWQSGLGKMEIGLSPTAKI